MATAQEQALRLLIEANTELARRELDRLDRGLDDTSRNADDANDKVKKSFNGMGVAAEAAKGFIVGFVASLSVDAVVGFSRAILEFADSLDAAAEKAGLGVARYQTLREGLRALEVDTEKTDGILGRLEDTLGAVQGGTAAAGTVAVLDKMGITSRILNGEITDTGQLLDAIAGSAKNFNGQAEFTAAVVDLVGRKLGIDLANALKDGGTALRDQEQRFRDTGNVVSDEYIARLADANEALDQFATNTQSRMAIWAAAMLGFFQDAGTAAQSFATGAANAFDRAAGIQAPKTPRAPADQQERDVATLKQVEQQAGVNSGIYQSLLADFEKKYGVGSLVREEPIITVQASRKAPAAPRPARAGSTARPQPRQLTPAEIRAGFGDKKPEDIAQLGPSTVNSEPLFDLSGATGPLDELIGQLPELTRELDLANAAALDFSRDLTAGFAAAIVRGGSLEDVVTGLGQRFAELALNSVFDALIGGALNSLFGGIFGGLGGSLFGGAFAAGGSPPVGKVSLVGEKGPELFVPRVPGTIIPNNKIGLGGGSTLVQNFDLRGTILTQELYRDIEARSQQAARDGAIGGRTMAGGDRKRDARRKLKG